MAKSSRQSLFFEILLKLGVVFFLLGVFNSTIKLTGDMHNVFWEPVLRVIVIVLFIGLALLAVALRKDNFKTYAFLMIFMISALRIFTTFASNGMDFDDIPTYTLLMIVSLYILYRSTDHNHSKRR